MANGRVYLVGAGPGDPGLLTVRGRAILERAEVVVYDRLANPRLLEHAPAEAERIYVGKRPGHHAMTQDEINAVLVEHGTAGKLVCRLKGGDPFVFGRGGEEALACLEAGVPFEVVPGITSSIAAPAYAGVPVTHRNVATSFAVITGHENPDKQETQVDWEGISRGADTLVFLMGIGNLAEIAGQLQAHGRRGETPAAVVQWGTWPRQRVICGTLADIAERVAAAGLKPPAVTVVGEVAALRDELIWFENRPLFGRTVVVTRSRTQASELVARLSELGAEVIELPVVATAPLDAGGRMRELVGEGLPHDWVAFTSTNAVARFFEELTAAGADARLLAGCRLGAVGDATAAALAEHGLRADFVPTSFSADDFVAQFPDAAGGRILFPCGAKARDTVERELAERGYRVERLEIYDTVPDTAAAGGLAERLAAGEIDAITFTSSSTAQHFRSLFPEADLSSVRLVAIGPKTAETMRELGLEPARVAAQHTLDGLIAAVVAECGQAPDGETTETRRHGE